MRLYLSGPLTDCPNYRRVFREAQNILEQMGHDDIVNPAELCSVINTDKFTYEQIMTICKDLLRTCDALILLPGYEKSHGCGVEEGIAEENDLIIVEFQDYVEGRWNK